MRLDLHIHTTASDGAWPPEKVVERAAAGGLDVIAVADHDTTTAVAAARAAGQEDRVQVIPALEVSSTWQGRDIHVLGYFVDPEHPALVAHGERASRIREERMKEMIDLLEKKEDVEVTFDEVEEAAGPERFNIGRPHLAKALVARGHASSVIEAFNALIGDHRPSFVPTELMGPEEAVQMIIEAGGVPVWAHPPGDALDDLLPDLVNAGLRGLEVYRPASSRHDVLRLERICRTSGLLMSGGSDWHTPDSGRVLGDFYVTGDEVGKLLAAGGL